MAMRSMKSWSLTSRVLLWSRVSVSFVFVYPPQRWNQHLSDQNVRKSRPLTLLTPSLVVLSLCSSIYPPPLYQPRRCILEHAQQMAPLPHHAQLNKLCRHFAPRSNTSRFKSISSRNCDLTPRNAPALSHWTCPTSACSSSPFLLKNGERC